MPLFSRAPHFPQRRGSCICTVLRPACRRLSACVTTQRAADGLKRPAFEHVGLRLPMLPQSRSQALHRPPPARAFAAGLHPRSSGTPPTPNYNGFACHSGSDMRGWRLMGWTGAQTRTATGVGLAGTLSGAASCSAQRHSRRPSASGAPMWRRTMCSIHPAARAHVRSSVRGLGATTAATARPDMRMLRPLSADAIIGAAYALTGAPFVPGQSFHADRLFAVQAPSLKRLQAEREARHRSSAATHRAMHLHPPTIRKGSLRQHGTTAALPHTGRSTQDSSYPAQS